jgi:hypothetical protein
MPHPFQGLDKLTLPIKFLPVLEQGTLLQSMTESCVRSAVGCNYVFSKLGRYSITKAQIAYFNSEPSIPLVNGLKQSGTDHMLAFFKDTKEISYHSLWDIPLNILVVLPLFPLFGLQDPRQSKLITEMIRT